MIHLLTAFRTLDQDIKDGSCTFPDELWQCLRDFYANLHWANFLKDMDENPRPWTLTHGDFHPGNIMWMPNDPICPVRIIDWEFVRVDSGPGELAMFLIGHFDFTNYGLKVLKNLVRIYYDELLKISPDIGRAYSHEDCMRDFAINGMRMWMLRLPILLSLQPGWKDHFVTSLEAFRTLYALTSRQIQYPNIWPTPLDC